MYQPLDSRHAQYSARKRVLKHLHKQKTAFETKQKGSPVKPAAKPGEDPDPDSHAPKGLEPGTIQLKSFYKPSLEGNLSYTITVTQDVETSDGSAKMVFDPPASTQSFYVHTPRFSLPPGAVHSTYPPQGLGDYNNILPHIVFQDPHMPWENSGSPKQDAKDDDSGILPRNKVPWLALLTFTEDELKLLPSELKKKSEGGLFPEVMQIPPKTIPPPPPVTNPPTPPTVPGREQDKSTFSIKLTMGEYLEMGGTTTPTVITPIQDNQKAKIDQKTQVDVILLPPSHVDDLFASYDTDGARIPIPPERRVAPDLSGYKFFAHVRNVNTQNTAVAGSDDDGMFSVVVARRSSPLDLKTPKPIIVHLVSLEGIEVPDYQTPVVMLPLDPNKKVAFISLYSWTYLCLPPEQVNFLDSMRHIGFDIDAQQCWLRAGDDVAAKFRKRLPSPGQNGQMPPPNTYTPQQNVAARLIDRLNDGYCLQRYRLQTGEETVSFYRGPLTPNYVNSIGESWWPYQSNFSSDYQILDRQLGIIDITYSAAWQLGKTLGIANQSFTAALVRLRGVIQTKGRRGALKDLSPHAVKSKAETLSTLPDTVKTLSYLTNSPAGSTKSQRRHRHHHNKPKPLKFRRATSESHGYTDSSEVHKDLVKKHIDRAAKNMGSSKATPAAADPPFMPNSDDEVLLPWNDISVPLSSDWQIVQNWIIDNMFLRNIPAHYLIPDPSYLPKETMRFFFIDNNWMDAFIDGALSLGNHLERDDDVVRQAFKNNLNNYFVSKYSDSHPNQPDFTYHPQIPCFGFFLRSAVVKAFPDLEIHAPWKSTDDTQGIREPTLRYESIAPDTLLCLFDRMPGQDHWDTDWGITLSQPPHQQCFRIGTDAGLTTTDLEVEFPAVYTDLNDRKTITDRYASLRTVTWSKDRSGPTENDNKVTVDTNSTGITVPRGIFDWESRMITPSAFAAAAQTILSNDMQDPPPGQSGSTEYYTEKTATSAMTGNVLTSFISKIKIELPVRPNTNPPPDYTQNPRKIRVAAPVTDPNTLEPLPHDTEDEPGNDPLPNPLPAPASSTTPPVYRLPGKPTGFDPNKEQPLIPALECVTPALSPQEATIYPFNPQFAVIIFPLTTVPPGSSPSPPPTSAVPPITLPIPVAKSADDHPIDLVVKITKKIGFDKKHKLQLFSIRVRFPVGSTDTDLLSADAVSSARMLHNARFNVHTSRIALTVPKTGAVQDYLEFAVIPRAAGKLAPLDKIKDLSFVVGQVVVSRLVGSGTVDVLENWRWQNGLDRVRGYKFQDSIQKITLVKSKLSAKEAIRSVVSLDVGRRCASIEDVKNKEI